MLEYFAALEDETRPPRPRGPGLRDQEGIQMAQVQCVKCGQTGEQMTEPLYLGKLEAEVKSNVCKNCWHEWNGPGKVKTMLINEYQINLGEETGREFLKKQMRAFLKLGDTTDTSKLQQNYRPDK